MKLLLYIVCVVKKNIPMKKLIKKILNIFRSPLCSSCGLDMEKLEVGYNGDWKWYCLRCRKGDDFPF